MAWKVSVGIGVAVLALLAGGWLLGLRWAALMAAFFLFLAFLIGLCHLAGQAETAIRRGSRGQRPEL